MSRGKHSKIEQPSRKPGVVISSAPPSSSVGLTCSLCGGQLAGKRVTIVNGELAHRAGDCA